MSDEDDRDSDDRFEASVQIDVPGSVVYESGASLDFETTVTVTAVLVRGDDGWEIDDETYEALDSDGREFLLPSKIEARVDAMLIEQAAAHG